MVLGLARNKWHVPVQILATALFVIGLFLAHAHNGRNYVRFMIHTHLHRNAYPVHIYDRNLILRIDGLQILLFGPSLPNLFWVCTSNFTWKKAFMEKFDPS